GPGALSPDLHGNAALSLADLKKRPGWRTGSDAQQDAADAKKMLDAAGVSNFKGTVIRNTTTSGGSTTILSGYEIVQKAWKDIGFEVTIQDLPYQQMLPKFLDGSFDAAFQQQGAFQFDPDDYMNTYFYSKGSRNYDHWVNADIDKLWAQ